MKNLITSIFALTYIFCNAQIYDKEFMWLKPQPKNIKELIKTGNNNTKLIQRFDKKGNCIFVKNDGLNGDDIVAIWSINYDDKGRRTRTVFAHSNIGFKVSELIYSNNIKKRYAYTIDTLETEEDNNPLDSIAEAVVEITDGDFRSYPFIKNINSITELKKHQNTIDVFKQKRYLESITILNPHNKPIKEIYFDHKRDTLATSNILYTDTSSIEKYRNRENWLDIDFYSSFDSNHNLIRSFRVFYNEKNEPDTSEYKNVINTYNSNNKIILTSNINDGKVRPHISYTYKDNRLISEVYLSNSRNTHFDFEYNKAGELIKEEVYEIRYGERSPINSYKTTYTYW